MEEVPQHVIEEAVRKSHRVWRPLITRPGAYSEDVDRVALGICVEYYGADNVKPNHTRGVARRLLEAYVEFLSSPQH